MKIIITLFFLLPCLIASGQTKIIEKKVIIEEIPKHKELIFDDGSTLPVWFYSDSSYIECGTRERKKKPSDGHFRGDRSCPPGVDIGGIKIGFTELPFRQIENIIRTTDPAKIRQTIDTAYLGEGENLKKIVLTRDPGLIAYIDVYSNGRKYKFFPADTPRYVATAYTDIQFEFDSFVLRTSSYPILDKTSEDLRSTGRTVEIGGYASSEGSATYNMALSRDRANAVKIYLVNSGVDARKIKIRSYGEGSTVADNMTEEGRVKNRRVSFKLK